MVSVVDQSQITKKNVWIIGTAIVVCLLYFSASLYRWLVFGRFDPLDIFIGIMLAVVLVERAQSTYTYAAQKKELILTKKNLFGRTVLNIPYKEIMGIYRYEPKLIGTLKFRRTYRFHSALDGRTVWTIAYKDQKKNSKLQYQRAYVKLSPDLLLALKERLPSKVMIPENEVVLRAIQEESETKVNN